MAIFALFLAAFTWGSAFCVLKDTLENVSPIWLLAFRFLLAGIIMTLVCIPRMKKMSIRTLKRGIIMGIVLYFEFLFFTVGLQYTTSSKSSFIIGSYVAILPLIYWVIRGKKPQRADILAALVCIVGLGFILLGSFDGVNKGDLISLLSAVCYAIRTPLRHEAHPDFCKGRGRLSVKYASDRDGRHFGTCGSDDPGATSGSHVRHEHRKHRLSGGLLHGCAISAQCVWTEICENFHKRRDPFF